MDAPRRDEAHHLLAEAGAARERLAGRGRPVRTYLLGYAVATLVLYPLIALTNGYTSQIVVLAFIGLVAALDWWTRRQPVTEKGGNRRRNFALTAWALLVAAALVVEARFSADEPAYWIPASLVIAAPLFLAALLPGRR